MAGAGWGYLRTLRCCSGNAASEDSAALLVLGLDLSRHGSVPVRCKGMS